MLPLLLEFIKAKDDDDDDDDKFERFVAAGTPEDGAVKSPKFATKSAVLAAGAGGGKASKERRSEDVVPPGAGTAEVRTGDVEALLFCCGGFCAFGTLCFGFDIVRGGASL